jgi:hypothetical protein
VEGDQEGIWAQVVEGDELCPLDPTSQTYFSLIDKARKVISSSDRYRGVLVLIALSGLRVGRGT